MDIKSDMGFIPYNWSVVKAISPLAQKGETKLSNKDLTPEVIAIVKRALMLGHFQHKIAAYFGFNQGRVSEVNTGKRGTGIQPSDDLPPDFPALA